MSTIDINTNQSDQQTQASQKPAVSRWTVLGDRMRMVRNRFVYIRRRELRMYSRRPYSSSV